MGRVLPILFNTEMVRAILDGKKTVTRRLIKPRYKQDESGYTFITNIGIYERYLGKADEEEMTFSTPRYINPQYQPGDILYVRETFCPNYFDKSIAGYRGDGLRRNRNAYKADYNKDVVGDVVPEPKWHPSIHMPKEAARIWLKVTNVRVERLQEITASESAKEGIQLPKQYDTNERAYILKFADLWDSTLKKSDQVIYGWYANPWVLVVEFERCEKPKDRVTG